MSRNHGWGIYPLICTAMLVLGGCQSVGQQRDAVQNNDSATALTVGKVQREIRVGMTNAEVAEVLGSPNIVSSDDQRREVWVYDITAHVDCDHQIRQRRSRTRFRLPPVQVLGDNHASIPSTCHRIDRGSIPYRMCCHTPQCLSGFSGNAGAASDRVPAICGDR